MKFLKKIYDWMGSRVASKYADMWLAVLFFIEASFFLIPVDPLLILYCIENNYKCYYYAALATFSSTVGGMFGYAIGYLLWDSVGAKLVHALISDATFNMVVAKYRIYQVFAVLVIGVIPIPYKAVTISAGFCHLAFFPFVLCSLIARGFRFFLVASLIKIWGSQIKYVIDRFFNYLVVAFICVIAISVFTLKYVCSH
ncbi:MAG: DedA family protein [bacterium]